ncbi:EF-hand domain-containing protein [Ramlibacter sp.]|uniref:EF-hand domain-containing protein n=1 Tax=Ramlibacter sp. TaxID=1917967 RepID=UPI001841C094|nr:EF-hand domain-containing protein [Ramlibacter sp.]MBA2674716.1 EF-hand domain-containing protein [Ramlibacter sp.]
MAPDLLCVAAAALLLTGAPVHAQQQSTPAVPLVAVPTATGGTSVAPAPANRWTPQQLQQAFSAADADGNGQLSRAEAQRLVLLPRSFEDMDTNKDGVLTPDEYQGGARQ